VARLFDRVKETATTTGTGDFTLAGAVTQYVAFSAVYSVGDEQVPYCIQGQTGSEWEVGLGTYSASNTLRRDKVYASSNSGALVNFGAGTKDVFVTIGAEVGDITGRQTALTRGMAMP
jgi:hypothetical protein